MTLLLRFFGPLLFWCAAGFVFWYNYDAEETGRYLLFPFLDSLSALENDLAAQATLSWILLAAIGALWFIGEVIWQVVQRRGEDDRRPR